MRRIVVAPVALTLAASIAGPASGQTAPPDPQAAWEAGQAAYLGWNAGQRGWRSTPSGLQYRKLKTVKASAPQPRPNCTVTLHYAGRLINDDVFDSSYARGRPATFALGRLIKGWQEGVPMMRLGETWSFVIPAELAYGQRYRKVDAPGRTSIPTGSALRFKIELLSLGPDCTV